MSDLRKGWVAYIDELPATDASGQQLAAPINPNRMSSSRRREACNTLPELAMALHARVGNSSPFRQIPPDLLKHILDLAA
jgi:hypothetical protein